MLLCHQLGYPISKPFGDRCKYDFIIDMGGELKRIQVKGTGFRDIQKGDSYSCIIGNGSAVKKKYTKDEIDYFAIYVIPQDSWYMIPVEEVNSVSINLYPHRVSKTNMFEKYKIK